jgi:hypothetical protein
MLDITAALKPGQKNELLVFVYDPTNSEGTLIPREPICSSVILAIS